MGRRAAFVAVAVWALAGPPLLAGASTSAAAPLGVEAVAVWQHRLPGGDWDVYYSLIGRPAPDAPASQLTWSTPEGPVAAPISALPGDDENPAVAINPSGQSAVALWQRREPDGTRDIFWSSMALPPSTGWPAPSRLAATPGDDFDPAVAVDSDGTALAVWVHRDLDGFGLLGSTWDGAAWSTPMVVPGALGAASLPELTFLANASAPGGRTPHRALLAYSDIVTDPGAGQVHRTRVALWDGAGFSAAQTLALTVEQATGLPEHGWADYTKPLGAFDRLDVGAEADGGAVVLWGGAAWKDDVWGLTSVMGSRLDPSTGAWEALRWTDSTDPGGAVGCESRHTPALAMTGSSDVVVAFGSHESIEFARRVRGAYASEGHVLDTAKNDLRPSLAPLRDRVLLVSWSKPYPAVPDPQGSTITWSLGTLRPPFGDARASATWEPAGTIDLPGDSRYPEVASVMGGTTTPFRVTMQGRAYGARVQAFDEPPTRLADTGDRSSEEPGENSVREPALDPHPLVALSGFEARNERAADTSLSTVAVDRVVIHTDPRVVLGALRVEAQGSCPLGHRAGTTIGWIAVGDGPPTAVPARTNTAIPLGLFVLRINEQQVGYFGATVNGAHLTGPGVDVVVARASAAVAGCVGTGPPVLTTGGHDH